MTFIVKRRQDNTVFACNASGSPGSRRLRLRTWGVVALDLPRTNLQQGATHSEASQKAEGYKLDLLLLSTTRTFIRRDNFKIFAGMDGQRL
jgi:hypothetical protein